MAGETVAALLQDIRDGIREHGNRNALLTSIALTGTISLFADNVSSGLNRYSAIPIPHCADARRHAARKEVSDYAYRLWRRLKGDAPLPESFVSAQNIAPGDHVVMQAAAQKYIDSSISKTINVPADLPFDAFKDVYEQAWDTGCKGCTTYRPNDITGSVLQVRAHSDPAQPELPPIEPTPSTAQDEFETGVVYMTQPPSRPEELPGQTYKLNWPETDHAMYITINDSHRMAGGVRSRCLSIRRIRNTTPGRLR